MNTFRSGFGVIMPRGKRAKELALTHRVQVENSAHQNDYKRDSKDGKVQHDCSLLFMNIRRFPPKLTTGSVTTSTETARARLLLCARLHGLDGRQGEVVDPRRNRWVRSIQRGFLRHFNCFHPLQVD